jgi:hypothetical protein
MDDVAKTLSFVFAVLSELIYGKRKNQRGVMY